MICDSELELSGSTLVPHIIGEINTICENNTSLDQEKLEGVAFAVDTFLSDYNESSYIESSYLTLLISQALFSVGEVPTARRLLFFGTGLIKQSEWEITGGSVMLILDFKKITVGDGILLELVFFNTLNIIIESIADIWEETSGVGVLGLRQVYLAASNLLGIYKNKKKVYGLASEIKKSCKKKLEKISFERKWKNTPIVMNIDGTDDI